MLSLIVAQARNGAIGRGGDIPWHAPEDLAFFQRETRGGAVIMGRKTWESLPFKPLKDRLNIVVSSNPEAAPLVVGSIAEALDHAAAQGYARVYGIGGAAIYAAMLPLADRLLITEVDLDVPDADVFFPRFPPEIWREVGRIALRAEGPACVACEYLRR